MTESEKETKQNKKNKYLENPPPQRPLVGKQKLHKFLKKLWNIYNKQITSNINYESTEGTWRFRKKIVNPFSWISNSFPRIGNSSPRIRRQFVLSNCNSIPRFQQSVISNCNSSILTFNNSRERIAIREERIVYFEGTNCHPRERIV